MSTGKIELSVGAVKIVDKNEMFTEEEINNINKIPDIEDELEESVKFEIVGEGITVPPINGGGSYIYDDTEIREMIDEVNESLDDMDHKIKEPITLNRCDEEMLKAIEGGEGTNFELLSIPRDNSVDISKLDESIKNSLYSSTIFDDSQVDRKGTVGGSDLYIINTPFKDCIINSVTVSCLSYGVGEVRIYERSGNVVSLVKSVNFDTRILGTTTPKISINHKCKNAYIGFCRSDGSIDFGSRNNFGLFNCAGVKTEKNFNITEATLFDNFSMKVKIETNGVNFIDKEIVDSVIKLNTNITEELYNNVVFDDSQVDRKGTVGGSDLYIINNNFKDCIINSITLSCLDFATGEVRIYEKNGDIVTLVKTISFDTRVIGTNKPKINVNYKVNNGYIGFTRGEGSIDFGTRNTFGFLNCSGKKTEQSFDITETTLFDNFSMKVKIETSIPNYVKKEELKQNDALSYIIVDKNGRGNYTSIQEAINNYDGTPIFVKNGIYDEGRLECADKTITMIGEDKYRTIIVNYGGLYGNDCLYASNGIFSNMSFISEIKEAVTPEIGQQNGAYAVHVDSNNQVNGTIIFNDCIMISDFNAPFGSGLRKDNTIELNNCDLISRQYKRGQDFENGGMGALFVHNNHTGTGDNCPNQIIRLNNCRLKSKLKNVIRIQEISKNNAEAILDINNCLIYSETNGVTDVIKHGNYNNFDEMSIWKLSDTSYGNTVAELNNTPYLFETTGNIVFLNGAYGDGQSHKASSKFSNLEEAKLIYPTIVSLDDELDQLSIEKTLMQTNNVKIPKGTFLFNRSLKINANQIVSGYNKIETIFKMVSDNTPIILLNGDAIRLSDIRLIYKNKQNTSHTNSHAILQNINVMNFIELNFIQIENCYSGIRGIGNWFNCSIKNIRINGYSRSSLWLDGSGSTGCYFENIYTTNWSNWAIREKYSVSIACHIQGFSESVINQLNIEHVICNQALLLNDNGNIVINSMHIEGQEQMLGTGGAIFSLLSNTHATINGLTMSFSGYRTDDYTKQDYNLCNLGKNTKLTFNDVKFHRMNEIETWNGSSVEVIKLPTTNLHNNGRIRLGIKPNMGDPCKLSINGFYDDSSFWKINVSNLNMNNYPYDIVNINENYYYRENNGIKEVYKSNRLNSGVWLVGDKNIFTTILDDFNYIGEVCTAKGDFATPSTGLTCTVVAWQSAITIDNGKSYNLNIGDRIEVVGVQTSESSKYFTISSGLYNGNKYNVREVIGNYNLSNCEIKIAPPTFKGFGVISS